MRIVISQRFSNYLQLSHYGEGLVDFHSPLDQVPPLHALFEPFWSPDLTSSGIFFIPDIPAVIFLPNDLWHADKWPPDIFL